MKSGYRPNDMLTVKQLSEYLNCSGSQVYKLKDSGEIKSTRIGSAIRFKFKDVKEYLESNVKKELNLDPMLYCQNNKSKF